MPKINRFSVSLVLFFLFCLAGQFILVGYCYGSKTSMNHKCCTAHFFLWIQVYVKLKFLKMFFWHVKFHYVKYFVLVMVLKLPNIFELFSFFVRDAYQLSGCDFEPSWRQLNFRYGTCFKQGGPWHSDKL